MAQSKGQGVVRWFNASKGFGFIALNGIEDSKNNDVFVHHSNIMMEGYRVLHEGDVVEFDIEQAQKGPQAINVHVLESTFQSV